MHGQLRLDPLSRGAVVVASVASRTAAPAAGGRPGPAAPATTRVSRSTITRLLL
nr:hypothetical protein [Streptomyces antibioticus]